MRFSLLRERRRASFCFFFSSRRRHTRWPRDWSSDVCSSDLEGPAPSQEETRAAIEAKLALVPRYRQKVRFVPMDLGRPVWVDDPHFVLDYHVRGTALPAPGGDEQLRILVGRIMSQRLDRSRPLWELWVAEGLGDGRWAMISKVHHCMVDGVSATDLLSVLLDSEREPAT